MLNKIFLIFFMISFSICLFADNSFSNLGYGSINEESINFTDGMYWYENELFCEQEDYESLYAQPGLTNDYEYRIIFTGFAVLVEDNKFIIPNENITIEIDRNGNMSSPDCSDLEGRINSNGEYYWSGTFYRNYEGIEYSEYLENSGNLVLVTNNDISGRSLNGDYLLTEKEYFTPIVVNIKDGVLRQFPVENKPNNIDEAGGIIVRADGSFYQRMHIINRIRMDISGYEFISDSTVTTIWEGRVMESGLVFNFIRRNAAGYDTNAMEERHVASGVLVSGLNIAEDGVVSDLPNYDVPDLSNMPSWYLSPNASNDERTDTGLFIDEDEDFALRFAEITASGNLAFQIQSYVRSSLSDYISESDDDAKVRLSEAVDQMSSLIFPVTVVNSYYNDESNTAYVQVIVSEEDIEKITLLHFEDMGISDNPLQW